MCVVQSTHARSPAAGDHRSGNAAIVHRAKCQTGPSVSQVRDTAFGVVVLTIQPLRQMPLGSCNVDRGPDMGSAPVVRSVLASPQSHHDCFEDLSSRRDQMQRRLGVTDAILGVHSL